MTPPFLILFLWPPLLTRKDLPIHGIDPSTTQHIVLKTPHKLIHILAFCSHVQRFWICLHYEDKKGDFQLSIVMYLYQCLLTLDTQTENQTKTRKLYHWQSAKKDPGSIEAQSFLTFKGSLCVLTQSECCVWKEENVIPCLLLEHKIQFEFICIYWEGNAPFRLKNRIHSTQQCVYYSYYWYKLSEEVFFLSQLPDDGGILVTFSFKFATKMYFNFMLP